MTPGEQMRQFWSRLTVRDRLHFWGAVFCTFVVFGFLRDVQEQGHFTGSYLAFVSITTGIVTVGYVLAMARNPRLWLPVVLAVQLGLKFLGRHLFVVVTSSPSQGDLADRLRFDATASIISLFLGYLGSSTSLPLKACVASASTRRSPWLARFTMRWRNQ